MAHVDPQPVGVFGFPATADVAVGDLCEIHIGGGVTGVGIADAYIRPITGATGPKIGVAYNSSTGYPDSVSSDEQRVRINLAPEIITVSIGSSLVSNRGQLVYATAKQTYTFSAPTADSVPVGVCLAVWDPGVAAGKITILKFSAEASHVFHACI